MSLQFFGKAGQSCRFQANTNLSNWGDIGSRVMETDGVARFADTNAPAFPTRFYRMVSP